MRREVTTVDDLREIVGQPNSAVKNKVGDRLSAVQKDWLAHSPLGFVATTDAAAVSTCRRRATRRASCTSSTTPRSRSRSGRGTSGWTATSMSSSARRVGTLFLIPGRGDTLRINGAARILADATTSTRCGGGQATAPGAGGLRPGSVLPLRQGISAVRHLETGELESDRRAQRRAAGPDVKTDISLDELEKYYAEENHRTMLY